MEIIAADSSAAMLNQNFEPQSIVAAAAVLVGPPYREPRACLAEPIFTDVGKGYEVIVHEAKLCRRLLETVRADVVHLDISFGAVPLERLSPIQFSNIRASGKAKHNLLKILPRLRKIAGDVRQRYEVEILAIGKESIPVRIAELTAGAYAIVYACDNALKENQMVLLGLPLKCQPRVTEKRVYLHSLIAAEHDIKGYAEDKNEILKKANITEMLNPCARGFRALKIDAK